jgi:hypothetical protein
VADSAAGPRPGGEDARATERQRTIDVLCEAFANDELEVEEFESRVEAAHRAGSEDELRRLLSGLPTARLPARAPEGGRAAAAPAPGTGEHPVPYAGEVREWSLMGGVLGGSSRSGAWVPARQNVAIAVMGGCQIDLREARLPPGETEIYVVSFWGGIEIIVPPWVRVETSGVGIMGGFDHRQNVREDAPPGAPVVRISGVAIMAGVEVAVRYPGESARDARRRRKEERRARRLPPGDGDA